MRCTVAPDCRADGAHDEGITACPNPLRTIGRIEVRWATSGDDGGCDAAGEDLVDEGSHQRSALRDDQSKSGQFRSPNLRAARRLGARPGDEDQRLAFERDDVEFGGTHRSG